jgi:ethanolamine ammonia-lyase small subunit
MPLPSQVQGKENSQPAAVEGSAEYAYYLEQVKMLNAMKQNLSEVHQQGTVKAAVKLKLVNSVQHMQHVVAQMEK